MKRLSSIILLLCLFNMGLAQDFSDRLLKKVEQKVNQRVDQKTDEAIDEGLDEVFEPKKNKQNQEQNNGNNANQQQSNSGSANGQPDMSALMKMFGGGCEVDPSYSFDHSLDYHLKTGSDEMDITYFIKKDISAIGGEMNVSETPTQFVMNLKDTNMVMLMDQGTQKIGICTKLNTQQIKKTQSNSDQEQTEINWTKTGRTKTILGYKCDEYVGSQDGNNLTVWTTNGVSLDMGENFSYFLSGANGGKKQMGGTYPEGLIMEFISEDSKGKSKNDVHLIITKVGLNNTNIIRTEGYTFY